MTEFKYQDPFPLGKDKTKYRLLTSDYVSTADFDGREILKVDPEGLAYLANQAMREVNFLLRPAHNEKVAQILSDPDASTNDRGVAMAMLQNAVVAAKFELPFCQDTGTATIVAKKGENVSTGSNDGEFISKGIFKTYTEENLRYSQNAPLNMYDEVNTNCNLPAQIDVYATTGNEYNFLFIAKGGGSANKSYLYQETKATINRNTLVDWLVGKMKTLGTAACPPYHVAFVIGSTSAEACLKTAKLASSGYLDSLPTEGNELGQSFRDIELEKELLKKAQESGIGAQFGGKYFAHDVRVVRCSRHGASCPIGLAVSCSADRNIKAKINKEGIWLEEMDSNPEQWLPKGRREGTQPDVVKIDLNRPTKEVLAELSKYPTKTQLALKGTIIVGRDIAHAKFRELIEAGKELPQYLKDHPIYYAGPAKTPPGKPSGSFGPTTASRMDPYVEMLQSRGASMIMIAKGNRSQQVTDSCKKYGGFYLGSIGGPAALLADRNIKSVECLDYPELGMEAVWKIEVEDFPAFILVDDKGNDFFKELGI